MLVRKNPPHTRTFGAERLPSGLPRRNQGLSQSDSPPGRPLWGSSYSAPVTKAQQLWLHLLFPPLELRAHGSFSLPAKPPFGFFPGPPSSNLDCPVSTSASLAQCFMAIRGEPSPPCRPIKQDHGPDPGRAGSRRKPTPIHSHTRPFFKRLRDAKYCTPDATPHSQSPSCIPEASPVHCTPQHKP